MTATSALWSVVTALFLAMQSDVTPAQSCRVEGLVFVSDCAAGGVVQREQLVDFTLYKIVVEGRVLLTIYEGTAPDFPRKGHAIQDVEIDGRHGQQQRWKNRTGWNREVLLRMGPAPGQSV